MGISFLLQLALISRAFAILGAYIPESEHIPQACKIFSETTITQKRPIDIYSGKQDQTKPWETVKEEKDDFFCSGTLTGSNEITSATHCSQLVINANALHTVHEDTEMDETDPRFKFIKAKAKAAGKKLEKTPSGKFKVPLPMAKRELMLGKIFATCGVNTSHPETRELKWEHSWPHPSVRLSTAEQITIDNAIFRTLEPFSFQPMLVAQSFAETVALLRNTQSCRAFGFGIDNKRNSGNLHGVRIYQYNKVSEYIIASQTHFNSTMFGDSGGTLTCKDPDGNDVLVGNVQGGIPKPPENWMGTKHDFFFTPLANGPVKRWRDFVHSLPNETGHCGEDPCSSHNPILSRYVVKYEVIDELNGLKNDFRETLNTLKPHYRPEFFAGYKTFFKQVEAVHKDIINEYKEGLSKAPVIHGRAFATRQRAHSDIKDLVLNEKFKYPLIEYHPNNPRMRARMLIQYLNEELFALKHGWLSLGKRQRFILENARENLWDKYESEIKAYHDSFKN